MLFSLLLACTTAGVKLNPVEDSGTDLDDDTAVDTGDTDETAVDTADTGDGEDSGETAETADTGDTGEDHSAWDDATLRILSPGSGDFLPYGATTSFEAVVYDAEGNATDFSDIVWTSDVDPSWGLAGALVDDSSLDVGVHALTATARLPNGDRLAYTIGGVLVQSEYTGTYSGTLTITLTIDKYSGGCAGGATFVVDAYGEVVSGSADCVIIVGTYELATSWLFDYGVAEGVITGTAGADLVWFTYDFDSEGTITTDGSLSGSWAGDVYGYLYVDGSFDATRVSRDIPEE